MFLLLIFRLGYLWLWNCYEIDWDDFANLYLINKIVEMKIKKWLWFYSKWNRYANYF